MAKASLTLPNNTVVSIEGTPEEVKHLLELYAGSAAQKSRTPNPKRARPRVSRAVPKTKTENSPEVDVNEIVALLKEAEEYEAIESRILDRASQVDRALLPLFIVYKYKNNSFGLTSGDIHRVTTDLGIPISTPNASTTLSSSASGYVIGDKIRRKGQPVRYKLSRRGVQYIESVLSGEANGSPQ